MSTNDTLLMMSNGLAKNPLIKPGDPGFKKFSSGLNQVCLSLAKMIVRDAEGATKYVEILVKGARREKDALEVAFSIAHSPLVKTAFFGEDINWGRILCAAGYAGVNIDPSRLDLFLADVQIVRNGLGCGKGAEERATEKMKRGAFTVRLDLNLGSAEASVFTSDLSYDYVRINGSYRS